ncbi:phage tail tape measure protein [Burkholderia pseudomallei]|nr:phage tail tape measure protein [Burkholderia pseudomallei]ARL77606.1 phage tail tape measure protein [Burkholderia pseudomallei]ARL84212.1 phage tail tape measure protein [Burkholderia pseudomallei]
MTVDATGYEAGMERAKRSAEAFLASQERAAARTELAQKAIDEAVANGSQANARQITAFISQLDKLSNTYGKTKSELLSMQAATLGVAGTAQPFIEKVAQMEAAMRGAGAGALVMAETEEQATTRITAMVEASLAASAAMTDQSVAATRYAESVAEVSAAATAAERANAGLLASSKAVAASQEAVAAQAKIASTTISEGAAKVTEALGRQLTALTATSAQMAVYDAEMAGMTEAEVAQIRAIATEVELRKRQIALGEEMAAAYTKEAVAAKAAHGATSGVTSELLVMGREAGSGNFTRLAGSFTRFLSLAGALDLLLNPVSIAFIAVGAAMLRVAEQNEKMNEALALTGDYAGVTADQLRNMASAATANGATYSVAAEAITELAARGRLTGDEIAKLGKTTADVATYTSVSVKQMVEDFTRLADEPVKASFKLNEQYHYLTEATYDQIVALEKQGDATGAAQVAVEAFSKAMDDRTQDIAKNEGIILEGWRGIKGMIDGAIQALGHFGADATPGEIVARLQANKKARLPIGQWDANDERELQDAIGKQRAAEKAASDKAAHEREQEQRINAKHAYEAFNQQFATPAEKRDREIQKYLDTIAGPLGLSLDQQLADEQKIADRFKDPKTHQKAYKDDAATRFLQQLRDQAAELRLQLSTTEKLNEAQKELAKFNQQVADWKGKTLTAEQQSLIAHQGQIRAQLQTNVELEKEVKHRENIEKLQERSKQIDASIASYQKGQAEQYGRQLETFGMGSEALKRVQATKAIYAEYQRLQEQLDKATPKELIGGAEYQQASADIKAGLNQSLADYDAYYTALKEKQEDWKNGAAAAFANYVDASRDAAAQAQEAVTQSLHSMESGLTELTHTGHVSFQKLADDIFMDITRAVDRSLTSKLVENLSSMGGLFSKFFSSHTDVAAGAASALPGDALENMMKLTKGFGTTTGAMSVGQIQTAMQNASTISAATATVATMTVGTMIGGGAGGGAGDALGGLLKGLGSGGAFAGDFGFTATGVTGSTDAVMSSMGASDTSGLSALMGLGGGFAASGGSVSPGAPYIVGESGPELFVPGQSGTIMPNHALHKTDDAAVQRPSGSRSQMFNLNITVPPGTTRQSAQQQASSIMREAQIAMARNG